MRWLFGSRDPPDLPMFDHLDRQDLINQVNWTWYLLGSSTWQARYGHLQERPLPRKEYSEFYLAFENSFCKDYVTEKFFNLFNEVDTIPVVRGGFEYHKFFPAGIYIDAADFPSPESLGAYLRELATDEQRYVRLLKRKNRFTRAEQPVRIACELCKAAHLGEPRQVYGDLYRWLRAPGNCWRPTDL
ncbi:hypothetical protein EGW08_001714 [Elysia chlorotica]|uniref:Fucosyltransferase n=1 Tax=Elysia chlorotica TaxID=188477 RepID=A0A433U9P5_ELYCH|nr:hypothetical protein EGW08_001714 [Elysia chlorotica]